jgi:hypothetical protein
MNRKSFKMAILGLVGFAAFFTVAYFIINAIILGSCIALLYMFQNPINSILIVSGLMALGSLAYRLYKK